MRIRRLIAGVLLVASVCAAAAPVSADGPKTRYERVLAEEDTLRLGRKPSPLSHIRRVIADYEAVVRRYPGSGYSDNALWQAAELSLAAHRIYRSDIDRETAARLLRQLVQEYPSSSLHDKAKQALRQARGSEPSVAAARTPNTPNPKSAKAVPPPSQAFDTPAPAKVTEHAAAAAPVPVNIVSMPARPSSDLSTALSRGEASSSASTSSRAVTLKDVKRTALDDLVRVTLEFDGEVAYTQDRIDGPARLFFDMKRTQVAPALQDATLTFADDSVRHIRLGRPRADITRLVIDLTGVDNYSVFTLYNPYRLTVDLHRATARHTPLVAKNLYAKPEKLATRVSGVAATRDLDVERRIQPRPLPYPMADAVVSPRLASTAITQEVEEDRRLQPRPLPHPLARVPAAPRVAPRAVALAITPLPLVPNRKFVPGAMPALHAMNSSRVAAAFVAPPAIVARAAAAATTTTTATTTTPSATSVARNSTPPSTSGTNSRRRLTEIASETPPPPPSPKKAAGAAVTDAVNAANSVVPGIPTTLPAPAPPAANSAGNFSLARQLGLGVSRIVIDPGHGGHDPGALGSKLNESEVTLDVALRLEKLLQNEPGFDVVLTRRTDVFIALEERTAIANRQQADLFLSIHVNSSRNKQSHGIETYHLNFASNPEAEAVAARENAGAAQTMNHLPEIVKAIALNNKLDESRDFAHMVQESMVGRLKAQNGAMRDLGVKQAPFVVLIGAGMPSVLAEIGFINNQSEASLLRTGAYRQKVAEALFDAVKKYQKTLKSVGTVASQVTFDDRD